MKKDLFLILMIVIAVIFLLLSIGNLFILKNIPETIISFSVFLSISGFIFMYTWKFKYLPALLLLISIVFSGVFIKRDLGTFLFNCLAFIITIIFSVKNIHSKKHFN